MKFYVYIYSFFLQSDKKIGSCFISTSNLPECCYTSQFSLLLHYRSKLLDEQNHLLANQILCNNIFCEKRKSVEVITMSIFDAKLCPCDGVGWKLNMVVMLQLTSWYLTHKRVFGELKKKKNKKINK